MTSKKWRRFEYCKVVNVVDGDTLDVSIDFGFHITATVRVRLAGIDTPEITRPSGPEELAAGKAAKDRVAELVLGKNVIVDTQKGDKYGRYISTVWYTTDTGSIRTLSETLINEGFHKAKSENK